MKKTSKDMLKNVVSLRKFHISSEKHELATKAYQKKIRQGAMSALQPKGEICRSKHVFQHVPKIFLAIFLISGLLLLSGCQTKTNPINDEENENISDEQSEDAPLVVGEPETEGESGIKKESQTLPTTEETKEFGSEETQDPIDQEDVSTVIPPVTVKSPVTDNQEESNTSNMQAKASVQSFRIVAKQWSFEPSTITVNEGDTVTLSIKSVDVDHGFKISEFGVGALLKPGETTNVEFVASKKGTYSFFCSVYCGEGHSSMKGTLVVK